MVHDSIFRGDIWNNGTKEIRPIYWHSLPKQLFKKPCINLVISYRKRSRLTYKKEILMKSLQNGVLIYNLVTCHNLKFHQAKHDSIFPVDIITTPTTQPNTDQVAVSP